MFAYFLCMNLVLLTRLVYLRKDEALGRGANVGLLALQLVLITISFSFTAAYWLVALLLVVVLGLNLGLERRLKAGWRVITLLLLLGGVDFIEASTTGLQLRPAIGAVFNLLVEHSAVFHAFSTVSGPELMQMLFGLLLLTNEINALIRLVFHAVGIEPLKKSPISDAAADSAAIDVKEFNAGRVIGFLERWLIYLVVLSTNELTAIGFIIAAKGLARMKQLEEKTFAEYMLIGTFLSVLSAVLVGKWVRILFAIE